MSEKLDELLNNLVDAGWELCQATNFEMGEVEARLDVEYAKKAIRDYVTAEKAALEAAGDVFYNELGNFTVDGMLAAREAWRKLRDTRDAKEQG